MRVSLMPFAFFLSFALLFLSPIRSALAQTPEPTATNTPTPTPTLPPAFEGCKLLKGVDGRYGWVYKPNGAHTISAVLVLPYPDRRGDMLGKIYKLDGTYTRTNFKEKSDGICRAPGECLGRATFKAKYSGQKMRRLYTSIMIKFEKDRKGRCVRYKIKNPAKRYD